MFSSGLLIEKLIKILVNLFILMSKRIKNWILINKYLIKLMYKIMKFKKNKKNPKIRKN